MAWNHRSVYEELLRRLPRDKENTLADEPYAWLYSPQSRPDSKNCAVLYSSFTRQYAGSPLHLNPTVSYWKPSVLTELMPFIRHAYNRSGGWECFEVLSWTRFAEVLWLLRPPLTAEAAQRSADTASSRMPTSNASPSNVPTFRDSQADSPLAEDS
jgi:hypothetical protein